MGFRFRRSVRLIPGVRLNFSKSGVSTSFGRRGLWFTVGPRGTRTTIGIPGTGISYTEQAGARRVANQVDAAATSEIVAPTALGGAQGGAAAPSQPDHSPVADQVRTTIGPSLSIIVFAVAGLVAGAAILIAILG